MDLIRALILRLEELPIETGDARTIEAGSTELVGMVGSKETIDYHLNLLRDAGFLNCPTSDQPNFGISYKGLTWAGHDLADSVRNKSGLQKCVSERADNRTASSDARFVAMADFANFANDLIQHNERDGHWDGKTQRGLSRVRYAFHTSTQLNGRAILLTQFGEPCRAIAAQLPCDD
jgi:hypothetical protein